MERIVRIATLVIAFALVACTSPPPSGSAGPATSSVGTTTGAQTATAVTATATVTATASAARQTATAADHAFAGKAVEFPAGAAKATGYLSPALPVSHAKKLPALVVIQEWWGLNDWIKENADRLATNGYVALAVDLYRGKSTKDPGEAHELMRGLPEDRAIGDLKAAVDYLVSRPDVDPKKIGVVGWCMGGGYSLALAVAEPRIKAAVINYGKLVTDPASLAKIQAALLGNFAGEDRGIEAADVKAFEKAMKDAKKKVDIKIYPGAQHAFMNPNNGQGFDAKAADDAWARIDTFFATQLPP